MFVLLSTYLKPGEILFERPVIQIAAANAVGSREPIEKAGIGCRHKVGLKLKLIIVVVFKF